MESKKRSIAKTAKRARYVVAVDMDNTIADMHTAVLKKLNTLKKTYPDQVDQVLSVLEEKYNNHVSAEYPAEVETFIKKKVMASKDFFYTMEPYPGAVQALKEMDVSGEYIVMFLTSPLSWKYGPHSCLRDKVRWIAKHFGSEWTDRVIFSKYKDLVQCDFLIDDLPQPNQFILREPERSKGVKLFTSKPFPTWTHVLYTQPYNASITDKPRITRWNEWKKTFAPLLSE